MKQTLLLALLFICCFQTLYSQTGSLDRSFGKNGIVKTNAGSDFHYYITGYQVLLQSDKAIYALIDKDSYSIITKRHPDGSLDSSYGENGYSVPVGVSGSHTLAIQQDGKILLAGNTSKDSYDFAVARYNTDGSLDNTFGTDGRQTTDFDSGYDYGSSVAVQNDGKIVVGGHAYNSRGSYYALARYNTNGSLDSSFGENGKVMHDFGFDPVADDEESGGGQVNICNSIAIQINQKIVAAGYVYNGHDYDFAVARYNADGSFDSTFSGDGKQTADFSSFDIANSVAIQKDGKIVLTGSAYTNTGSDFALARFTSAGNLDNSFSDDGKQTLGFDGNDVSYTVAIQPDGKIVSVGYTQFGSNTGIAIARFKTDGSIDNTFNHNVKNTFNFANQSVEAISVAAAKDGKIVVVGDFNSDFFLLRLNKDGTRDKSFADNGILRDNLHQGNTAYAATAIEKDGKIVAAGYTYVGSKYAFLVTRYNTDGSLDNTFSKNGKQITTFTFYNCYATSVAVQNDGKIVAAGYISSNNKKYFAVVRYNSDGSLDSSFNGNGKLMTDFGKQDNQAYSVAIQSDGKIVAGGSALSGSTIDFAIARYNTDGSLDKSFSGDGKQTTDFGNNYDVAYSIAIDSIGKIVTAGSAFTGSTDFAIARYNSNGELDNTFGNQGKITTQTGEGYSFAYAVALQADGKIVAGGYSYTEGTYGFTLVRYNTDGSPDSDFSKDGTQVTHFGSYAAYVNTIAIQNDGKLVAGGYINNGISYNSALARYNNNGTLDSTFADSGKNVITASPGFNYINNIAIANNKLYAVGYGSYPGNLGVVTRYFLDNSTAAPPSVSLTSPADNATYLAPAAHIKLIATASDTDGTIAKVEFYNGTALLHTDTILPYGFVWKNVPLGNYILTAKAYDNSGNVTTSAPVHISVVPNTPPAVSIIKPLNNQSFADPAYIQLLATAADTDGRITRVEFYNGTTLLRTEYKYPYTYNWTNIPAGAYIITAVATDNWGAQTTSAPITVTVTSAGAIVGNRPHSENKKTALNDALSVTLSPNPATNIVNIYANGLQQNKPATLSIISTSGTVLKNIQISNSTTQLNVSSFASGVYTIKVISGDKVFYRQFVKL